MKGIFWAGIIAVVLVIGGIVFFSGDDSVNVDSDNNVIDSGTSGVEGQEEITNDQAGTESGNSGTSDSAGKGTFELLISDEEADIGDFESVLVTFSSARVFPVEEGFIEMDLENASVDLTNVIGNASESILVTELDAGTYTKLELYVESVEAVLVDSNETPEVTIPSGKLMITKTFNIIEGEETTFVFDIHIVKRGNQNSYNLRPNIVDSVVMNSGNGTGGNGNETNETMNVTIEITDIPEEYDGNGTLEIMWEIMPENITLENTAIYYSNMSIEGEFGLNMSVEDSGYEMSSEVFENTTSGEFTAELINITETIYVRAHALIDGDNYWTEEFVIEFV